MRSALGIVYLHKVRLYMKYLSLKHSHADVHIMFHNKCVLALHAWLMDTLNCKLYVLV